jgi:predicted nucleic-acid-binding protein
MIAVDTNILARFYLNDDEEQAGRAARLLAEEDVFVPKTVLLELEWVLRGVARISPAGIARSLTHLLSLPNVRIEDETNVKAAVKAFVRGMDFADALHVASSADADRFATFDVSLAKRALRLFPRSAVVAPPLVG